MRRVLHLFGDDPSGRFKLLGAALIAALATMALGFTLVYRIDTTEEIRFQAAHQCRQIEQLKAAITDVLEDGLARLEANRRVIDPAQYRASLAYYHRQINRFRPKGC